MLVRKAALKIWSKYLSNNRLFLKKLINEEVARAFLSEKEKSFISEMLYGACRKKYFLEYVISKFAKKKSRKCFPYLSLGAYQILFMDSVPDYASVNEIVELSKKNGLKFQSGFINAVLRNIVNNRDKILFEMEHFDRKNVEKASIYLSYPLWIVKKIYKDYGPDKGYEILNAMNLKYDFKKWKISDEENFFISENQKVAVDKLGAGKGFRVFDVCSAPGTKARLILKKYSELKTLVCADINLEKLRKQKKYLTGKNYKNVFYLCTDMSDYPASRMSIKFERILVDAPCTNSGELSRRPEARWRIGPADVKRLASLQKKILVNALQILTSGGLLVYSTCSIFMEENSLLIKSVFENLKGYEIADMFSFLPKKDRPAGGFIAVIKKTI